MDVFENQRRKTELSRNGSFANNCSDLMKEWAWEENNQLGVDPYNIPVHYKKKVYWKCQKCNHVYQTYTFTRKDGTGCPKCCASKQFSLPEKLLAYYIKQWFNDTIENYRPDFMKPKEIDIYIPSINIGIEYDGEKYHHLCRDYARRRYYDASCRYRTAEKAACRVDKRFGTRLHNKNNTISLSAHRRSRGY